MHDHNTPVEKLKLRANYVKALLRLKENPKIVGLEVSHTVTRYLAKRGLAKVRIERSDGASCETLFITLRGKEYLYLNGTKIDFT